MKSIDQLHIIYPNDWKPVSSKMKLRGGNEHVWEKLPFVLWWAPGTDSRLEGFVTCCEGRMKCFRSCYLASAGCDCGSVPSRWGRLAFLPSVCMTSPCGEVTTRFPTVLKHDAGMLTAVQRHCCHTNRLNWVFLNHSAGCSSMLTLARTRDHHTGPCRLQCTSAASCLSTSCCTVGGRELRHSKTQ